jgi:hypothetical protein
VCLCEAFKNLNASKMGIFIITEKTRVIFAKCIWMGGNIKIGEGLFLETHFSYVKPL